MEFQVSYNLTKNVIIGFVLVQAIYFNSQIYEI
jgi:hypothetical protein